MVRNGKILEKYQQVGLEHISITKIFQHFL